MLVRNYGATFKREDLKIKEHRTESILRLQMDAQIDENVTARARWNMIENNGAANEWHGGNKGTGDVEVAYIQIKDMFSFGGDFKFGRDWYQHGHGFVIHNYMDAVNYTKRCGDVDLALNVFFDRDNDPVNGKDTYNIWNINADYSTKGHDIYLGIYYHTFTGGRDFDNNLIAFNDNAKKTVIELGASGKLSNNNDKLRYELGFVHSDLKFDDNDGEDQKGNLGHVAIKYDDQKQLKAKLAYTFADDEYDGTINTENMNRFHDGDNSVFEDLALLGMAAGDTTFGFYNMKDIKLELEYTLKNNDKHSFRLAYDILQNDKDGVANTGSWMTAVIGRAYGYNAANPGLYADDTKVNVITFEYSYKLAENTRLRLGYQNGKFEAKGQPDMKTNLYYTELFSKF
jgi:hypothetical protein